MKKLNFLVRFVLIFVVPFFSQQAFALTSAQIDEELRAIARDANAKLPSGNSDALLVAVTALSGKRFAYKTIVKIPAQQWTQSMRAHSHRIAVNDYCTNPGMAVFREMAVIVSWEFSDRDGRYIMTNTVSPQDCRN